jgi:hypothetical protein
MNFIQILKQRDLLLEQLKESGESEQIKILEELDKILSLISQVKNSAVIEVGDNKIPYRNFELREQEIEEIISRLNESYGEPIRNKIKSLRTELINIQYIKKEFEAKYTFEITENSKEEAQAEKPKIAKKKK